MDKTDTFFMVGYALFVVLVSLAGVFLFALVLINAAMGCGETFYYPNGTWETGECFLIPYTPVSGEW